MLSLPTQEKKVPPQPEDLKSARMDLDQAFESFLHVAGILEGSYGHLRAEISRLREELEVKNAALAQSLAENERIRAYLSRILESLPCGVLVVNRDLDFKLINPEARRLLNSNSHNGTGLAEDIPANLKSSLKELVSQPSGEERVWSFDDSADARTIAINCAGLPEASSAHGDLVLILRDITEQRRLEREREIARRMRALAEMTALLAHEIRNPLASLELFAGLIQGAVSNHPEASQWAVHLHAGLRGLSATVNNVLHFYTQAPPQTKPINLAELIDHTVQFLQPLALQRGMAIQWEKPAALCILQADPHRLQQVFFNLAINAFRSMNPGGRLTIRLGSETTASGAIEARIDFEDQGMGIPPEILEKIFEPGFTTRAGSPGLGLAVCQKVVEEHQGRLSVWSAPSAGTTFTLTFPLSGGLA